MSPGRLSRTTHWLLLAGAVLLAAALRFYALGRLPPGLYHDEAYNGLDALNVLNGARPIFFEANNGREPLFIYLVAVSVHLLGRTPIAVRAVSAVLGTLTVPAAYLMGRALYGRRTGLFTAAITAIAVWPVNLSRIGFRAVALPLVSALLLWQLWRGLQTRRWAHFGAAGLLLGLSLYTYLAARFVPLAVAAFLVIWGLRHRSKIPWRGLAVFILVAAVLAASLLGYMASNLSAFTERGGQVSIFNPAINHGDFWGTLARHLGRTALMFNLRGDFIPRHNVPLRAVFDPLTGLAFLVGLAIALHRRSNADVLVLVWLAVLLAPTVLAEDAPHFLRAVGVLPVLFVLPALALDRMTAPASRPAVRSLTTAAAALVLAASLGATIRDYFVRHAQSEAAYYAFETGPAQLASQVNQALSAPSAAVYLSQRLWRDWPSVRFLVADSPRLTLLREGEPTPTAEAERASLFLWPYEPYEPFLDLLPRATAIRVEPGPLERGDLDNAPRLTSIRVQAWPAIELAPPGIPLNARFGPSIELGGADLSAQGDTLHLVLYWHTMQRPDGNYTVFVHVEEDGMPMIAGDSPPARGYYTTNLWRPGDWVVDEHEITLPRPFDPKRDRVTIGLYRLDTMERLPAQGAGVGVSGDSVTLTGVN